MSKTKSTEKLDERMSGILADLDKRLGDSEDRHMALYVDRVLHVLLSRTGIELSREQVTKIIDGVCSDKVDSMEDLLNCVVRNISRVGLTKEASVALEEFSAIGVTSNTLSKLAYPNHKRIPYKGTNTISNSIDNTKEEFPFLLRSAHELVSAGVFLDDALRRVIDGLTVSKQLDFLTWYSLEQEKRSGNKKDFKYLAKPVVTAQETRMSFKKLAFGDGSFAYEFMRKQEQMAKDQLAEVEIEEISDEENDEAIEKEKAAEFRVMRDKMVNRTFSIDKLLEKHRGLLADNQFETIEDVLNTLRKNIRRLKMASLDDSIEKTAYSAEQNGWFEGAMLIRALKDEQAFIKTAGRVDRPAELQEVLDSLEEISGYLRQRGIVRELAARDIDLYNLGFGYLSEIGEAAAKLVESFNSAANKIDDAIGEMKSELQTTLKPKGAPRNVKSIVDPETLPLVHALRPKPEDAPEAIESFLNESAPKLDKGPVEINDDTDIVERPAPRLLRSIKAPK